MNPGQLEALRLATIRDVDSKYLEVRDRVRFEWFKNVLTVLGFPSNTVVCPNGLLDTACVFDSDGNPCSIPVQHEIMMLVDERTPAKEQTLPDADTRCALIGFPNTSAAMAHVVHQWAEALENRWLPHPMYALDMTGFHVLRPTPYLLNLNWKAVDL